MLYEELEIEPLKKDKSIFLNWQEESKSKKSVGKALFLSLLIPGAGEYYAGEIFYTKVFLGIEVIAIGSLFLTDFIYRSKLEDSRVFGSTHAGINPSGKDNDYWRVVGKYDDIFLFNQQRLRERRTGDLIKENDLNSWSWDSTENRFLYDRKRLDAHVIRDSESFIIAAIFLNHLISTINAVRLTRMYNKKLANNGFKYNLVVNSRDYGNNYIGFTLTKSF